MMDSISMYSKLPNLVLGFHGCDQAVYDDVVKKRKPLESSNNKYDWLGHGIYFWEQSYERALEWATNSDRIKNPRVIGAVLDLGNCLNLIDSQYSALLKYGYQILEKNYSELGLELPQNKGGDEYKKLRNLDCAVIQQIHSLIDTEISLPRFDSVRGAFIEGNPIYPGAGFKEKTHIQVCIVNPNCIKGYFDPLMMNTDYDMP